jgi:hypothetical protein
MSTGPRASASARVWVNRTGQPAERLPGEPAAVVRDLAGVASLVGLVGEPAR